jgi:hypothetical protein
MKRFSFGGDEDNEDEEEMDAESEARYMFPDPSEFITMTQFENPDHNLLNYTIKICEKSWFWNFYRVSTKIKMIRQVFENLKIMTEGQKDA